MEARGDTTAMAEGGSTMAKDRGEMGTSGQDTASAPASGHHRNPVKPPEPIVDIRYWNEYYDLVLSREVAARRYMLISVLALVVSICLAIAISIMMPLKTVVPYFVEVRSSGEVVPSTETSFAFTPSEAVIVYHMQRLARASVSAEPRTSGWVRDSLPLFRRGDPALQEWQAILEKYGVFRYLQGQYPPEYRRTTELLTRLFPYQGDPTAIGFRYRIRDTNGDDRTVFVYIKFRTEPPGRAEDVYVNPAGLWVEKIVAEDETVSERQKP